MKTYKTKPIIRYFKMLGTQNGNLYFESKCFPVIDKFLPAENNLLCNQLMELKYHKN